MAKKFKTPSRIVVPSGNLVITPGESPFFDNQQNQSVKLATLVTSATSMTPPTAVKTTVGKSLAIEWTIEGLKKPDDHILDPTSLSHGLKISSPGLELPRATKTTDPAIPVMAERLLLLILPKTDCEYLLGDLEEIYWTDILPRHGPRYAKWWYRMQVLRSTGHILLKSLLVLRLVDKLTDWLSRAIGF